MKVPLEVLYSILAGAGGLARYLNGYLHDDVFKWRHLFAHFMISTFSGLMFGKFALFLGVDVEVGFIFAGVGGFMGIRALELLEGALRNKLK